MAKKKTTRKKKARTPAASSKSRRAATSKKTGKTKGTKKKAKAASTRSSSASRGKPKASKRPSSKSGMKKVSSPVRKSTSKKKTAAKPAAKPRAASSRPAASDRSSGSGRSKKSPASSSKPRPGTTAERKPGMLDPTPSHPNDEANARNTPARLTRKQLNHFRELLLKRRAELIGDVQAMESGALRGGGSGDSGHAPMHMADAGSDTYDQEFALQLAATERELLEEIDKSLENIRNGTYGVCEVTGTPISLPRLEAKPWAKVCIEVARERDRFHRFRR